MGELQTILQNKEAILAVARLHGLHNIRIFGSIARGEDTPQSDIDLLVDTTEGCTLLDMGGAAVRLQELLGRKVDIVTERGLHWSLREEITKEARPLQRASVVRLRACMELPSLDGPQFRTPSRGRG